MRKSGKHKVPLPVSLYGIEFKEMLKVEVLVPKPRFNHMYVKGW